jgi:hypothetical protein
MFYLNHVSKQVIVIYKIRKPIELGENNRNETLTHIQLIKYDNLCIPEVDNAKLVLIY